ncbi:MAG TPA: tetratricopeptide repeat protein [Tepidisphaeraceae bacterium]|nr:tetratricopeptide repeat protein [Tepidisphaeraceae bacterium]
MALVRLGRRAEAGLAIDAALARDPENATTHANQGWTLLHQGQHKKAMEHFREALRLDPQMDWARAGIVEALKARNPIYRIFLAYFLFMGRLSRQAQWGIIIGGYVAYRIVLSISQGSNSPWTKLLWPLIGLYIAFAVMTWLASPLFNLLLRLDRFGRYALSNDQKWGANLVGGLLLGVIGSGVAFAVTANPGWLVAAIGLFVLMIPASVIFKLHARPRLVMAAYSLGLLIVLGTLVFAFWGHEPVILPPWTDNMINVFIAGVFLSQWVGNGLLGMRVRR